MADAESYRPEPDPPAGPGPEVAPREAYRDALRAYDGAALAALAQSVGLSDPPSGRATLALRIADHLREPRAVERAASGLAHPSRLALTLMAVTETTAWPLRSLGHALAALGVEVSGAVEPLVERGLVAVARDGVRAVRDPARLLDGSESAGVMVFAHPAAVATARTALPGGETTALALPRCGPVRQTREADGLEPIVRLAALWQRVTDAPLRQTQQSALYKRDRDRLEDDPVLAGPVADALEPIPDMPSVWLALARGVGLLVSEPGSERVTAAPPSFWADNAIHLPRMIAIPWLALRDWHEQGGVQREGASQALALPFVRAPVLLWLATLGEGEWVTTADVSSFLRGLSPQWAAASFVEDPDEDDPPRPGRGVPAPSFAAKPRPRKARPRDDADPAATDLAALEAMLLGAGYQFGLVRAATDVDSGGRAVQLTALGRYVLALGPPPPPRPAFEHFLFVQPNFEVIAYRQGLTPALIGQFSRFSLWTQAGAALALRLTAETVYRGLEGGLTPEALLGLLARHSPRPLPAGVSEAVRTWAGRRDRVTYHASATLVEFATPEDLDEALREWPAGPGPAPARVSDRLVLVEDESAIPWGRFRMTGSRNYRLPADACVEVEPDGITLTLELARSDLLVDAELSRFADETPLGPDDRSGSGGRGTRRRFVVSFDSLARAEASGLTPPALSQWFQRRTGADVPPAVRLLLSARGPKPPPLTASRPLVLNAPSADLLDGLTQHPETRDLLGPRLGPTSVVIPDAALPSFRRALERLGLAFDDSTAAVPPEGKAVFPRVKSS